jgi:pimeloyl-ACP methyl ester carboxylesterase
VPLRTRKAGVETRDTADMSRFGPARLAGELAGQADDRPPLVLLHGLTFDRSMWQPTLEALRRRDSGRQVLLLDLPGHGQSPEQPSYAADHVADLVHGAVEQAGLRAPVLVGHSIAAAIASIYASRYPTRGVVNVDQTLQTGPFFRMLHMRREDIRGPAFLALWNGLLDAMNIDQLPDPAQQLVRSTSRPRQHIVVGYWQQVLDDPDALASTIDDTLAVLRRDRVAYLIVAGGDQEPGYLGWLHRTLPQVTLTVVPRSGHFPHLADPTRFAECLATAGGWSGGAG